jgi:ATP-dependent DNA helicase RecG
MNETQNIEKKRLTLIMGKNAGWNDLAKSCVGFANARGGTIKIGISDDEEEPPLNQKIDPESPHSIMKRISELTVNVSTIADIVTSQNNGQYIALKVLPSISTIASTTDGKYYCRVSDNCVPLMPEELIRLLTDKPAYIWETKVIRSTPRTRIDFSKLTDFVKNIQASDRVSPFIKSKSTDELLDHYLMADGSYLTNLGILWVGQRSDRAKLLYAPTVQFLKYDEQGQRVNKIVWDDFSLNPQELIESVWSQIPDWREGIEVSDGLFRKFIPNYEEEVIRELLVNAIVHRPYTTRGDIFIKLFHDKLEIHNPGLFPIGINENNILHKTIRRNEHLAKVFYDLKLMEREGSGYDKMYEILLGNGKEFPVPKEGDDRVMVTIKKRITNTEIVSFINRVNEEYQLRQKEVISLGIIAQHTSVSAIEFSSILNLPEQNSIRDWLGRLVDMQIIKSKGRTKGMEYFINPDFLRKTKFRGKTNLKTIEEHRLKELIYQDIKTFPNSAISEIHQRIGTEISQRKIKVQLDKMKNEELISPIGEKRWTRYSINAKP